MKNTAHGSLKKFDLFGVIFELRMQGYEKFRSETGAIASLSYFAFSTICALLLLTQFIKSPIYSIKNFEEPTNSQQIKWKNENFKLAIKLPNFYDEDGNTVDHEEMFYVKAIQRSRNTSRILSKTGKETKIPVATHRCNISEIFTVENLQKNELSDYEDSNIVCLDLNETHFIKNSQFTNHSYVKIEIWVNRTYFEDYRRLVKKHMEKDPFYLNLIFPVNIISDDYAEPNQFVNGIFLYLNEKEKTIADIYLKKSIYRLDDNVIMSNPVDYHYNDYYSHDSYNIIDDFFYKNNATSTENSGENLAEDQQQNQGEKNDNDPKIAKIYVRNHIMSSTNIKTRQKLLPFLQNVNSIYINFFFTFKVIFLYINLNKAKIHILQNLFEVSFSDLGDGNNNKNNKNNDNAMELNENESYRKLKSNLNLQIQNVKDFRTQKPFGNHYNNNDNNNNNYRRLKDSRNANDLNKINLQESYKNKELSRDTSSIPVLENSSVRNLLNIQSHLNNINVEPRNFIVDDQHKSNYNHNIRNISIISNNTNNNKINNFYKNWITKENELRDSPPNNKSHLKSKSGTNSFELEIINNEKSFTKGMQAQKASLNDINIINKANNAVSENKNSTALAELKKNIINTVKEELQKKIKGKNSNSEQTHDNQITFKNFAKFFFGCKFSKIKKFTSYYSKTEKLFDYYFDIRHFIKKMNEIETLKSIVLSEEQKFIFEFLSYPNFKGIKNASIEETLNPYFFVKNEKDNLLKSYESLCNEIPSGKLKNQRLKEIFESQISD